MRNVSDEICRKKSQHTFYIQKRFTESRAIYVTGNVEKCHTVRKVVEENIKRRKRNAW